MSKCHRAGNETRVPTSLVIALLLCRCSKLVKPLNYTLTLDPGVWSLVISLLLVSRFVIKCCETKSCMHAFIFSVVLEVNFHPKPSQIEPQSLTSQRICESKPLVPNLLGL